MMLEMKAGAFLSICFIHLINGFTLTMFLRRKKNIFVPCGIQHEGLGTVQFWADLLLGANIDMKLHEGLLISFNGIDSLATKLSTV